jgi:glutamyl-tRNA reductase
MKNLVLVGLNHKTAPVEIRERIAFPEQKIPTALNCLRTGYELNEAVILSTCNRVEICAGGGTQVSTGEKVKSFLCDFHGLAGSDLEGHLYRLSDTELIRHVFRVASSLDSMVVGESQILGQMKSAFSLAGKAGAIGHALNQLMPHAFFVAKRVRTETRVATSAVSISSVAVELATKIFGDLNGRSTLVVGAGKMSELAARALVQSGVSEVRVANRTPERAAELAEKFGGRPVDLESMEAHLCDIDIAIFSTGAEGYVLDPARMEKIVRKRKYRPLLIIDISVPRNVDPAVNEIENVFLFDIDDLDSVVNTHLEDRAQEARLAEEIVEQEVSNFVSGRRKRDIGPVIGSLRHRIEDICLEELAKNRNGLTPKEYERIERLMRRAAHRIAHPLLQQVKSTQQNPARQHHYLEMIKKAFELEDKE